MKKAKQLNTRRVYRVEHVVFGDNWCAWQKCWRDEWHTNLRIRQFVLKLFEKYFGGRKPTFHWHLDGKMAEASDRRGNCVMISQVNFRSEFDDPFRASLPVVAKRFPVPSPFLIS